jgi:hypothetical protein
MEHSLPSPVSVGPWRTATIVAVLLALLELVALVAAGAALFGPSVARSVQHAATRQVFAPIKAVPLRAQPKPGPPTLSRTRTSILVLNGNGRAGAAAAAATRVHRLGYTVAGTANAAHTGYVRSIVMFRAGFRAEALRFARDLHVQVVSPLDGLRPADLHGAKLAVVLGRS